VFSDRRSKQLGDERQSRVGQEKDGKSLKVIIMSADGGQLIAQ